jgi:hypothetical protein
MILMWFVAGAAVTLALVAWNKARRTGRRLEQLTEMYWELKYQHGELRAQLQRPAAGEPGAAVTPAPRSQPTEAFVPLTSLRR